MKVFLVVLFLGADMPPRVDEVPASTHAACRAMGAAYQARYPGTVVYSCELRHGEWTTTLSVNGEDL